MNINLKQYGLDGRFEGLSGMPEYDGLFLARVSQQHRGLYKVIAEGGEINAGISGKLAYQTDYQAGFPAVGDWVMIDKQDDTSGHATIHHILHRKSVFVRKAAGTSNEEQVIAANIDVVFLCMSLNEDFNLRRMERYLAIAWDSMAKPVIVLTKSDLCENLQQKIDDIMSVSMGVDVLVCSAQNQQGYTDVKNYVEAGKTIAFIGSSGVGKSTLINRLMGQDVLTTSEIRQDDGKGRHTTTHRQLLLLPDGGIVIDTPGMRELQLYAGNIPKAFEDIEGLAAGCKYKDCSHSTEPGCLVKMAIKNGELSSERFESYLKLQREISYDGLNSRQLEQEKINRMFGSKGEMKQQMKHIKQKKGR